MKKQGFTIIELLISIIVIGILSTLLFRTMAEMIRSNSRIQQEKIIARELISIQTSINTITEHYNILDTSKYVESETYTTPIVLYLKNNFWQTASIYASGDSGCETSCSIVADIEGEIIELTNPKKTKFDNLYFKILPVSLYTNSQYTQDFKREHISQPWFWIFWNLRNNLAPGFETKSTHTLQHFVNLTYQESLE